MASINKKLKQATVGIAGLGGLGSTVAVALARAGIGRLIVADFDKVESGNLTRQQYFTNQIGKSKVNSTVENLRRINPDVEVTGHPERLDADSVPVIFAEADVIAECFDRAEEKQMIVETVLTKMDRPIVVTVSGLAGYGNSNAIQTRRISERLILIGDGCSGIDRELVLTAPRVGIAACHQANAVVEVIINEIRL
ncbi:MAG: sulfur carrier protein ThiS adenylyltransferase ThiF [Planctomycetota bacterium]|jgi:sulfur carrier protein ThiS adenylyltransferase